MSGVRRRGRGRVRRRGREGGGGEREGKEEGERGRVTYCGMWNSPVTTLLSVLFTPSVWRERGRGRVK